MLVLFSIIYAVKSVYKKEAATYGKRYRRKDLPLQTVKEAHTGRTIDTVKELGTDPSSFQ